MFVAILMQVWMTELRSKGNNIVPHATSIGEISQDAVVGERRDSLEKLKERCFEHA